MTGERGGWGDGALSGWQPALAGGRKRTNLDKIESVFFVVKCINSTRQEESTVDITKVYPGSPNVTSLEFKKYQ